jgi:hypothetical protein
MKTIVIDCAEYDVHERVESMIEALFQERNGWRKRANDAELELMNLKVRIGAGMVTLEEKV